MMAVTDDTVFAWRRCRKCDELKPLVNFDKRYRNRAVRHRLCKSCQNDYCKSRWRAETEEFKAAKRERSRNWARQNPDKVRLMKSKDRFQKALRAARQFAEKYGYAACVASVEEIKAAHTGYCHNPGCGVPETECRRRLNLDHCHVTGLFRGWLCGDCNIAEGKLKSNVVRIAGLAEYLRRHESLTKKEVAPETGGMEAARPYAYDDWRLVEDFARCDRNFAELEAPTGMVTYWPGPADSVPPVYVILDGRAVSRADHKALYVLYGTRFGEGDGRTTFNVPSLTAPDGLTAVTRGG